PSIVHPLASTHTPSHRDLHSFPTRRSSDLFFKRQCLNIRKRGAENAFDVKTVMVVKTAVLCGKCRFNEGRIDLAKLDSVTTLHTPFFAEHFAVTAIV